MEESFNWIKAAISSCKSEFHLDGCHILIGLFKAKYKNEPLFISAYDELRLDLIDKETFIIVEV